MTPSTASSARRALDDFHAFVTLSSPQKLALAREIATELGDDFQPGASLVGEAELATLVHAPTGVMLVLVPGGTFTMGFTDDDRAAVHRYFDAATEPNVFAYLEPRIAAMSPAREVRVRPFAMARSPLATVSAFLPSEDARSLFHASNVPRAEIAELLAEAGWRFPSEAEWEYVAREGRAAPFLLDAAARYRERADERTETAWGIAALGPSEHVADRWHDSYDGAPSDNDPWTDGNGPWMSRGSFPSGFEGMQSRVELVGALAAFRCTPAAAESGLRLVLGADEAGRWRLSPRPPEGAARELPRVATLAAPTDAAVAFERACKAVDATRGRACHPS